MSHVKGYDRPLYLLPFDHRASFQKELLGVGPEPTAEQAQTVRDYKQVIFEGFLAALDVGVPKRDAGILVDEEFGAEIARRARAEGITLAMPAEKSGQEEFEFQYDEDFAAHIVEFDPTFCKVLVRYNPEGDVELNRRQAARLAKLSDWLSGEPYHFMFELLVPATREQMGQAGGDRGAYDEAQRPRLMLRAIAELQAAGVDPDVWKVEGLDRHEDCAAVVGQARQGGRDSVGIIVLGRGETEAHVERWLEVAAQVPGYIGFAVGRTAWWEPLVRLRDGKISRETATGDVATDFKRLVDHWLEHAG
jgi:myo-inositol catabolism protein IolC